MTRPPLFPVALFSPRPAPGAPPAAGPHTVRFQPGTTARQRALVGRLCDVAAGALTDDTLTMARLAAGVGMSRATLYRRLAGVLVGSPGRLLLEIRLARAALLLAEGSGSVAETAFAVGFRGPSHFTARFRGRYGMTPTAFKGTAAARRRAADLAAEGPLADADAAP